MATITATLTEGLRVEVTNGRQSWTADEPADLGGTDTGPNPYELLLGALASCTCITVSLYCRRKGWALDNVSVEYSHDRVHADDCEECEDDVEGYLDRVRARVFIDGDFDEAQRARLQEIAVRCPVHKTLERGITFADEQVLVG